jgi:tetrapyrrole methylase family protein/MazG family protein
MSAATDELIAVMDRLLGEDGCPWDREQTHTSLARFLIEETYEVVEAINSGDMNKLREELGDLLLQVVFHSALAAKEGAFSFDDVARSEAHKMIQRHPHVFGDMDLKTSNDVLNNWEQFKKKEGKKHLLEGIPSFLPALMRAEKIQEKAARVGFDWPTVDGALEKFQEEVEELSRSSNHAEASEEMGDVLFALVNIARLMNIEPEQALQASNDKFSRRIAFMEKRLKERKQEFRELKLEELDKIWEEAKNKGL